MCNLTLDRVLIWERKRSYSRRLLVCGPTISWSFDPPAVLYFSTLVTSNMCTARLTHLPFLFWRFLWFLCFFPCLPMCCRYSVGDTKVPFCLQSCVKPLEYAVAVHDLGSEHTHYFVGKEPSGFRFNKLSLNEDGKCHGELKEIPAL